ncbi:hypothetical protein [Alkalicoccus daliensis]|uniref:Resolvase HTH domain-containing protein n=1 Tax=Alkalicoccus daliensis TaxID=745820 RepID=A0A1H0B8K0_9BACI|nr:hypothetical protein [Alkalicoccus daliensis]SDN41978.1 hypothetical protein SAMN04488053_101796 [Alkalicoccus daliensis]
MAEWLIGGLFLISILLFIVSYLKKDSYQKLEKQMEENSIQMMQEMYFLKKKIQQLEDEFRETTNPSPPELSRNDILELQEEGYDVAEIARITGYTVVQVEELLYG